MKKIVSIIIAVVFVFSAFVALNVSAEGTPTFSMSSATVNAGETANIKISLKNNPGIASAKLTLSFDSDLELKNIVYGNKLGGMTQGPQTLNSPVILNWVSPTKNLEGDVLYATLKFSVSKTAKSGKHNISISYNPKDVFNLDYKEIDFKTETGAITVKGGTTAVSSNTSTAENSNSSNDTVAVSPVIDGNTDGNVIKASDYDDGNYTGAEINLFEDEEDDSAVLTTGPKNNKKIIIICVCAVLLLLIAAASVIFIIRIIKNKPDKE